MFCSGLGLFSSCLFYVLLSICNTMKALGLEIMEQISGGAKLADAACVVKHGLAGAVSGGIVGAFTGPLWAAGVMGGLLGGYAYGIIMCKWY